MYVSKNLRIILVWPMVDFLGRRKAALYCFYFHRKCPERP